MWCNTMLTVQQHKNCETYSSISCYEQSTATDPSVARRNFTDTLLRSSMVFSEFELVNIYLPDGTLVPLPHPLGSPEGEIVRLLSCMVIGLYSHHLQNCALF